MTVSRFRLAVLLVATALSANAAVPVDPNNARGFADKVFHLGDLDSINTFNGNLVVRLPIGGTYTTGPSLSDQLVLTNNSRVWDYEYVAISDTEHKRRAIPETESNGGLGWVLSLGRLIPPLTETYLTPGHGWIYFGPDGSQHEFFPKLRPNDPAGSATVLFTNDGSYLRLTLNVQTSPAIKHRVDFPDGTRHEFLGISGRLTEIRDRFDNVVRVAYASIDCDSNPNTPELCDQWTITDGHGETASTRSHVITFANKSALYSGANFKQVVRSVALAAFGGATATYSLEYFDDATSQATTIARGGCGDFIIWDSTTVAAPLLKSVTLPDGSKFQMDYQMTDNDGACSSGALSQLTLPTRGSIKWEYGGYVLPLQQCNFENFWTVSYGGVRKRSFFQPGATTTNEVWTYTPAITSRTGQAFTTCGDLGPPTNLPLPPEEMTTTVVNPMGDKSIHYFSVYPPQADLQDTTSFLGEEYGLPLTRHDQLEPGGRALSSALYDCTGAGCTIQQKSYVEYESDGSWSDRNMNVNSRLNRQRVTQETDTGCASLVCRVDTDQSQFDGYGHYRKSTVASNVPSSIDHETFTNFNPGSSSTGKDASGNEYFANNDPWILGTYDFSWVKEGTSATKAQYEFDASTGVLKSSRRLKAGLVTPATDPGGIASTSNDLLTAYCRNTNATAGTRGFVTSERLFGGDKAAIPSGDLCTATRADGQYFNDSVYTFSGADLTRRTSEWAGSGFLNADVDIDTSTGLVKASRDSAGLETTFDFDTMGRATEVRPPSQGWTRYVYSPSATPQAKVEAQIWAYGTSPTADPTTGAQKDDYFYFDGFGRLILSKSRMPSPTTGKKWATTKTEYDAAGRVTAVSAPVTRTTAPFESLTPSNRTTYTYDVFGRVVEVLSPDGSSSRTSHTGNRKRQVSFVEATTPPPAPRLRSTEEVDGRGRLIKVIEPAKSTSKTTPMGEDATTTYGYDLADRLVYVKTQGAVDQERFFSYDNRGWLKSETHPEKGASGNGTVTYGSAGPDATNGHDAAGLVCFRKEGTGMGAISTTYSYDSAQRLTTVKDGAGQTLKTFEFATANSGSDLRKGKLYKTVRYNDLSAGTIIVTETYKYAELGGRLSQRDTKVEHKNAPGTITTINEFSQTVEYEPDFARPKTIGYPTCSAAVGCSTTNGLMSVGQLFDKGALETVTDFATLAYDPTGMVTQVQRTTPTTSIDTYVADSGLARPESITFAGLSSCTPPSQPLIQSGTSVCPSSTSNQASVATPVSGMTYTWSISGAGTITSSTTGPSITFNAQASGSISLTVTATNACGSAASAPRELSISGPTASVRSGTSIDRGQSATLTVDLTGTGPWNLTWSDGQVQNGISTSPATRVVSPLVTTMYELSSVSDASCTGTVTGNAATIIVYPPSPAYVIATSNNRVVTVSWPASSGASSYALERSTSRTGSFSIIATTPFLALNDTVPASATPVTYVYRVRAVDSAGTFSQTTGAPRDFATTATLLFAEEVAAGWEIKGSHVTELQKAVDALRTASGLSTLFGSAPSLVGAPIAASDFTSLISALNAARSVWGLPPFGYSGVPGPSPGEMVYAAHVTQLRDGVR